MAGHTLSCQNEEYTVCEKGQRKHFPIFHLECWKKQSYISHGMQLGTLCWNVFCWYGHTYNTQSTGWEGA